VLTRHTATSARHGRSAELSWKRSTRNTAAERPCSSTWTSPNQTFTVVIFARDQPAFPRPPASLYEGKNICVTGRIDTYKGRPEIVARIPGQIALEEPARPGQPPRSGQPRTVGSLKVLLNSPLEARGPSPKCQAEICRELLRLIDGSKRSIDFAIYGLRAQPAILHALVAAKRRGVRVRGVVDKDIRNHSYYGDTDQLIAAIGTVRTNYLQDRETAERRRFEHHEPKPRCERPAGFRGPLQCVGYDLGTRCLLAGQASREPVAFEGDIMHHKFFVFDGRYVWTGSANVSDSGTGGYHANAVAVIDSERVARWYTDEFDEMYRRGRFHAEKADHVRETLQVRLADGTAARIAFSPQGDVVERELVPLLQGAKETISVAMFYLTHKALAGELIRAARRGVHVRVIVDATSAVNGYSKHELLRAAGIPVKVENWGGKMHMKTAVVDGRFTVLGSMNWTRAGDRENDEDVLIVDSRALASRVERFFEVLWRSIPDKWLAGRPDPESHDSASACSDGMDNDFDGLVDASDPGCSRTPPPLPPLPPYRLVEKTPGHGLFQQDGRVFCSPEEARGTHSIRSIH
jgi:phosphatidylserine/phosphatidylglycerophosphate/cardiolipin synthase-like enzyme